MLGAIAALSTKHKGDRKPYEVEGDRTSEGRMNDRKQSEGLWAIARSMGVGRSHRL
jgi:hypothetical protein